MTVDDIWKFKEQQIVQGISSLEQEEIKLEHAVGNTKAMLRHLRGELAEHNKKKPAKPKP